MFLGINMEIPSLGPQKPLVVEVIWISDFNKIKDLDISSNLQGYGPYFQKLLIFMEKQWILQKPNKRPCGCWEFLIIMLYR